MQTVTAIKVLIYYKILCFKFWYFVIEMIHSCVVISFLSDF